MSFTLSEVQRQHWLQSQHYIIMGIQSVEDKISKQRDPVLLHFPLPSTHTEQTRGSKTRISLSAHALHPRTGKFWSGSVLFMCNNSHCKRGSLKLWQSLRFLISTLHFLMFSLSYFTDNPTRLALVLLTMLLGCLKQLWNDVSICCVSLCVSLLQSFRERAVITPNTDFTH